MAGFQCPYCSVSMPTTNDTFKTRTTSFEYVEGKTSTSNGLYTYPSCIELDFYKCPNCNQYIVSVTGIGDKVSDIKTTFIRPTSLAKQFPDFIPLTIRQDYEEAYSVLNISPKASATLSRRCIQGMIHDKWQIKLKNLNQEITALKDKIEPGLWAAIDSLRELGNIGAHMEKDINFIVDIDAGEAEKLIMLVEILIKEWYIVPHERDELLSGIVQINTKKQNQRKGTE